MYASTPPLEALRWILSHAATVESQKERHEEKVILIADVSRAFFEAPIHRKVAVELPKEALTEEEKAMDLVGMLDMSLYGTRDAALNFQKEVGKLMSSLGFRHRNSIQACSTT